MMAAPLVQTEAEAVLLVLLILATPLFLFWLYTVPSRIRRYLAERSTREAREQAAEPWIAEYRADTERQQAEARERFEQTFGATEPVSDDPVSSLAKLGEWAVIAIALATLIALYALVMWMGQWWGPGWVSRLFHWIGQQLS
jgi:hypothetical protein